jgi:hypothetical protein
MGGKPWAERERVTQSAIVPVEHSGAATFGARRDGVLPTSVIVAELAVSAVQGLVGYSEVNTDSPPGVPSGVGIHDGLAEGILHDLSDVEQQLGLFERIGFVFDPSRQRDEPANRWPVSHGGHDGAVPVARQDGSVSQPRRQSWLGMGTAVTVTVIVDGKDEGELAVVSWRHGGSRSTRA